MRSTKYLLPPTLATGMLMAAYLLLRPYGDSRPGSTMAEAFASPRWVIAHTCGALGLAAFAWLALRLAGLDTSRAARFTRGASVAGAALVLPYFGVESFGLHAIGARAQSGDLAVLDLVDQVRYQPPAISMFGVGLILMAISGIAIARIWSHRPGASPRWAAWPLGALLAMFLPQFFLPELGRMLFGIAYLAAAALFAISCLRTTTSKR